MSAERWEEQLKQFLRKTGDYVRCAGDEIKAEAQRLFDAAMDPQKHQGVRDRLSELTLRARKAAEGVAGTVKNAASKAGAVFQRTAEDATEQVEAGATAAVPKRAEATRKPSQAKPKPARKKGGKRKG